MAGINFTKTLQQEYENLYSGIEIRVDRLSEVEKGVDSLLASKGRYEQVGNPLGVPWYVVGIIHSMESGRNFNTHLHNGDPLSARTVRVPAGRPVNGNPPFKWEISAIDALTMSKLDLVTEWNLPRILYEFERYNGWGYRLYHPHVLSPYLWCYSNHYVSGKYIADGTWSDTAVSKQIGAAVYLRRLQERKEIPPFYQIPVTAGPYFKYSNKVEPGVLELQRFLNTFDGITLLADGIPGKKTSEAVQKMFGYPLKNTPE